MYKNQFVRIFKFFNYELEELTKIWRFFKP